MSSILPGPESGCRRGWALLAVIAALAVAELLVLGLWRVAAGTIAAANESAIRATARLDAESALRRAVSDWDELAAAGRPAGLWYAVPGTTRSTGPAQSAVQAINLYRGVRLLRATSTIVAGGGVRARASAEAALSVIPVDELWLDFHSAVVSGGDVTVAAGDTIDGSNAGIPAAWSSSECPAPVPARGARPGLALASPAVASVNGAAITGTPALLTGAARSSPSDFDRIGSVAATDFSVVADRLEAGSIALSPASPGTVCDTTLRGNWGEPTISAHPCHDYFPIVYAGTDTDIVSGQGQGILIVDGNLRIAAGVEFYGAILVRGTVDAAGAGIHGSLRIAGPGASRLGGAYRYEECALDRAFHLAPGLRRLYRVTDRWWLPGF